MGKQATSHDAITKAAALYLLERGLASYSEVAELSGRSRQIVRHWAKDHATARQKHLAKLWARALRHG
jgi:predicted transcriptional regulator